MSIIAREEDSGTCQGLCIISTKMLSYSPYGEVTNSTLDRARVPSLAVTCARSCIRPLGAGGLVGNSVFLCKSLQGSCVTQRMRARIQRVSEAFRCKTLSGGFSVVRFSTQQRTLRFFFRGGTVSETSRRRHTNHCSRCLPPCRSSTSSLPSPLPRLPRAPTAPPPRARSAPPPPLPSVNPGLTLAASAGSWPTSNLCLRRLSKRIPSFFRPEHRNPFFFLFFITTKGQRLQVFVLFVGHGLL